MPLYEYECGVCGHRFEVIQKFADPPLLACPTCGGMIRKLQSAPAFQLKGTGWYATDYPKAGQAPADKSVAGEGAGSSGNQEATKDKSETGDTAGKSEKSEKSEPPQRSEKSEKSEKVPTAATPEKTEKGSAKDVSSSGPTKGSKTR